MRSESQIIGGVDDAADVLERHVGTAGMEVGDHRDGELASPRGQPGGVSGRG